MQQNNSTDKTTSPNRGKSVVKTTYKIESDRDTATDKQQWQVPTKPLSIEEIRFINLVAKGYSLTSAYRQAYPAKSKLAYETIRANASRLYNTNYNIQKEVETKRNNMARLARLSEDRIEHALVNGKDGKATNEVAMFMFDHANGKATQRIETTSKSVSVNIDLTGKLPDKK